MNVHSVFKTAAALSALMMLVPTVASAEDLVMWERTGGNAAMVDELVRAWNEANGTYAFARGLGASILLFGLLIALHPVAPRAATAGS